MLPRHSSSPTRVRLLHVRDFPLLIPSFADPETDIIRKNMLFPTLEDMKIWLQEYSVRHHRPFIVTHSDVNKRYTVRCERGCGWKVWGRKTRVKQWKIAFHHLLQSRVNMKALLAVT